VFLKKSNKKNVKKPFFSGDLLDYKTMPQKDL